MIYDTDDNPISSYSMSVSSGAAPVLQIRADCKTGYSLSCETVADLAVEARKLGDTVWINIETTPISLAAYDGTRQTFEIRMTAAVVTAIQTRNFKIRVAR
jgi:hypothetical protein